MSIQDGFKYDGYAKKIPITRRNYVRESEELLVGLSTEDLYTLYEIVIKKLRRSNSPERDCELLAVKKSIEKTTGLDFNRLDRIIVGYKSEMAHNAMPLQGFTKQARKKV